MRWRSLVVVAALFAVMAVGLWFNQRWAQRNRDRLLVTSNVAGAGRGTSVEQREPSGVAARDASPGSGRSEETPDSETPNSGAVVLVQHGDAVDQGLQTDGDTPGAVRPSSISESARALRQAYRELKAAFGEGGRSGWRAVGDGIAQLQEKLFADDDGFAEFLALLDAEPDAFLLEAVLHHLPLADTPSRHAVLDDTELHEAIWGRFKLEEDPRRRMAWLRFFAFNPRLNASKMDAFLAVAREDPSEIVRELSVDAIASHRELVDSTWNVLADVAETDTSPACRVAAIRGLALVEDARARRIVHSAFTAGDERLRAAALRSAVGENPPREVTGGDVVEYLLKELRGASQRDYKRVLVERLLTRAPNELGNELARLLPQEKDWGVKKDYRTALRSITDSESSSSVR